MKMKKKNSDKVSDKAKKLFKGFFNKATGVIFSSITSAMEETADLLHRGLQEVKDIKEKIEDKIEEKLETPDPLLIIRRASNPQNLNKSITGTNKIGRDKNKGKEKFGEDEDEGEVTFLISEFRRMPTEEKIKQLIADHHAEELKNDKDTNVEDKFTRLPTQAIIDQLTAAHAGLKNGLEFTPEELKKLKKNPEGLKSASSTPQGSPRQSFYHQDKEDNSKVDSTSLTKTYISRFKSKPAELKKNEGGIGSLIQQSKENNKSAKYTKKFESNNKSVDPDREDTCTLDFEQIFGGKLESYTIEFPELYTAENSFVNDDKSDMSDDNSEFGDDFIPESSSKIVQIIPAQAINNEPKKEIIYPEDSKDVFEYLTLIDITNGSVILKPTQTVIKEQTTNEYNHLNNNNNADEIDWTLKFKPVIEEVKAAGTKLNKINKKIENPKAKSEHILSIIEEKTISTQMPVEIETEELGIVVIPEAE